MLRSVLSVTLFGALVIACQAAEPPPAQSPPPAAAAVNGLPCGMRLFATVACQIALDQGCCPVETECGKDPDCVGLASCVTACRGKPDACANRCALDAQYAYCNRACAGRDGDCVTLCVQRAQGGPVIKYGMVASCSKDVRYPAGVRCGDGS